MIAQLIPWTSKDHGIFLYQASGEWFILIPTLFHFLNLTSSIKFTLAEAQVNILSSKKYAPLAPFLS
jgi:hypothetical protein